VKTYVFDASALLALLERTSGTVKVNELLKEANHGHCRILMSSVNYGEVYGKVLRDYGHDQAVRSIGAVRQLPIELYDATPLRVLRAQDIKFTYKLYSVDSFAAALAIENKTTLVTSDSDFRKLGHSFPILWLKSGI
jgi:predicted nucleic acid-binding protein